MIVPRGRAIVRTVLPIVVPQVEAIDRLSRGDIFTAGTDGEAGADAVDYKKQGQDGEGDFEADHSTVEEESERESDGGGLR